MIGYSFQRAVKLIAVSCAVALSHIPAALACATDTATATPSTIQSGPTPPEGTFTIVDIRRAADVAGGPIPIEAADAIGQSVILTSQGLEFADMSCDAWTIEPTNLIPRLGAPDLLDVFVAPIREAHSDGDHRIAQSWVYTCEGVDRFEITHVDNNIVLLHLFNSLVHAIAETPFDSETVKRMQHALSEVKFYDGPIDGVLSVDTLAAVSGWAEYRMPASQRLRYLRPAITRNLFDTMGVFKK